MKRKPQSKNEARRRCVERLLITLDAYYRYHEVNCADVEAAVAGALTARFGQAYVVKKVQP